jgi:hypothetical protein
MTLPGFRQGVMISDETGPFSANRTWTAVSAAWAYEAIAMNKVNARHTTFFIFNLREINRFSNLVDALKCRTGSSKYQVA